MLPNFNLIKKYLIHILEYSSTLTEGEKSYLSKTTNSLSDSNILKLLFILENDDSSQKVKTMMKVALKAGVVGAIVVTPGAIPTSLLIRKLLKMYNWKCGYNCKTNNKTNGKSKLCYKKCEVSSLKQLENKLKSEILKCKFTKNPTKCKNKLFDELIKVKQKQVTADLKLKQYLRNNK